MHCYEHQKNVSAHYQIVILYLVVILDLFGNYSTKKKTKNDIKCYNKIYKKQTNTFTIKRYRNENKLTKFYLEFLSQ